MKTRESVNLTKLGAIYGALWGFVVGPMGTTSLVGDGRDYAAKIALSMAGWALLGAPVGIAVTRHFGPRLRHASWRRVLGLAPLTLVAGLGHATLGSVDWSLLGLLLTGSLPGIWLGTRLMRHTPERLVRSLLSVLLAYAGVKLIAF